MSEAMRNQHHQRNRSKANADLKDELDLTGTINSEARNSRVVPTLPVGSSSSHLDHATFAQEPSFALD